MLWINLSSKYSENQEEKTKVLNEMINKLKDEWKNKKEIKKILRILWVEHKDIRLAIKDFDKKPFNEDKFKKKFWGLFGKNNEWGWNINSNPGVEDWWNTEVIKEREVLKELVKLWFDKKTSSEIVKTWTNSEEKLSSFIKNLENHYWTNINTIAPNIRINNGQITIQSNTNQR